MALNLDATAIRSVSAYTASPVECCDRCSAGIKYVFAVTALRAVRLQLLQSNNKSEYAIEALEMARAVIAKVQP
jgi:hypothetical protein